MILSDYLDAYAARYAPYKAGRWCYEDGCIYWGLHLLAEATGDPRWNAHLLRLIGPQVAGDGRLRDYTAEEFNIDNILAGRVLLPLGRLTGDPRFMAAAGHLAAQLGHHPRIPAGNYWHKQRYPHQVWLDGLYMGLPFQIEYALATGDSARITDALLQFATALVLTVAPGGLHVHGYDDSRLQSWADARTGKSAAVWARAMGWLVMALVDALGGLPPDAATASLRGQTRAILLALAERQGALWLWPQVLDQPQLAGNYDESSASAMFAYTFLRAARLGLVAGAEASRLRAAGLRALTALSARVTPGAGLTGICHVAGLGPFSGRERDGSPGYYLTEDVVSDDAKGVGPLMMAVAESVLAGADGAG
ncbi:glycoside hydrolase family 88/105 protein [Tabrizicola fusiformis]|uniref:glycoside hydrolase family 88/105 protein n=1 Tax=Tabrizicola sp. SY72 TaxID=2741673 RepID=UPI001572FB7A|nr:glycoside hydrolase family 88 protein [Tabrizicola sp. SY72]NTT87849.1 glycoside hydrolase family 88 protein [Tabrizicola sp. SY72]